jgi:hypothetical protein
MRRFSEVFDPDSDVDKARSAFYDIIEEAPNEKSV